MPTLAAVLALCAAGTAAARGYDGMQLSDVEPDQVNATAIQQVVPSYTATAPQCDDRAFASTIAGMIELFWARTASSLSTCRSYCAASAPTLERCTSEDWMNSICGRLEASLINRTVQLPGPDVPHPSRCVRLIREHADGGGWPVDLQTAQVMTSSTLALQADGSVIPVAPATPQQQVLLVPHSVEDLSFVGLAGSWYGQQMQAFTQLSKEQPSTIFLNARTLTRALWEGNGDAVDSCAEYTYEKYYDYSLFEDRVATLGPDYRAIFELAYTPGGATAPAPRWAIGTHGLAGEPIRQRNSTPLHRQIAFPAALQPKNSFFAGAPFVQMTSLSGELVTRASLIAEWQPAPQDFPGGRPVANDLLILNDDLHARLLQGRTSHNFVESWQWHRDKGAELAGFLDEELYAMGQLKEEFELLLRRRSEIRQAIQDYWIRVLQEREENLPRYTDVNLWSIDDLTNPVVNPDPIGALLDQQRLRQRDQLTAVSGLVHSFEAFAAHGADVDVPQHSVMSGTANPGQAPGLSPLSRYAQLGSQRMSVQASSALGALASVNPSLRADLSGLGQLYSNDCSQYEDFVLTATCQLAQAEGAIEAALLRARDLGCLELDGPNRCDWSPKMFYERVQDPYSIDREPDHDACQTRVKDSFPALRAGSSFQVDSVPVTTTFHGVEGVTCTSADWGAFPDEVERYVDCRDAWTAATIAKLREVMAGSGTQFGTGSFGKSYGDGLELGNDVFGATLSYATAWHVKNMTSAAEDDYCRLQPDFAGSFDARARALYMDLPLVHGSANLDFATNEIRASVRVLDQNVVDGYDTLSPERFNVVEVTEAVDKTLFRAGATFVVVVVPVSIRGGAAGQVGVGVSVGGGRPAGAGPCLSGNLALSGAFRPFASVSAFASASVDLVIAEAGVKANLTLVSVELPLTANLLFVETPNGPDLKLDTNLDLVMSMLSGRIAAFVEICYVFSCDGYEKTLFRWDGPHHRRNIYNNQVTLSVLPLLGWLEQQ